MSSNKEYLAYLRVKRIDTREIVHSIGVNNLSESHVERVMCGMLRQMNTDEYFIDDEEVDEARERQNR